MSLESAAEAGLEVKDIPIGYFGAGTGAAAAIETAVYIVSNSHSDKIYAIVSRGGRPDLASSDALKNVKAATLKMSGCHSAYSWSKGF